MAAFASLRIAILALFALCGFVAASSLEARGGPVKYFEFDLTWQKRAPDGYEREMFLINGQFPGPKLELNEGDDVVITLRNFSPYNTSIHYHGIEMLNTPWSDGVPGLSMRPIQPGCAFTYKWTATQHGTFWYHSHIQSQINDGLYGPIVIHPKAGTKTPYSLITTNSLSLRAIEKAEQQRIPMVLSDWRHIISPVEWDISQASHLEHLCFDSMLINGKGAINCLSQAAMVPLETPTQAVFLSLVPNSTLTDKGCVPPEVLSALGQTIGTAEPANLSAIPHDLFYGCNPTTGGVDVQKISKKSCDTEKWVMFDFIATFGLHTVQVSIDELTMWVVAADGNYLVPTAVNSISMANGQRYTVLVKLDKPKKYTVRVSSTSDPQILFGTSIIDFTVDGKQQSTAASVPWINERGVNTTSGVVFYDANAEKPYPPTTVPQTVDATYKVVMKTDGDINMWAFNQTKEPLTIEDGYPILFKPEINLQNNHTITVPSEASWVDYVMQVPVGQPPHPVHIHGRHFYVIGQGSGAFNWSTVDEAIKDIPESFNLVDPPMRDTFPTPASGLAPSWLVLRRPSDNPGVWFIHCHIMSHLQGGMSMVLQDGTDDLPRIPSEYKDWTCAPQSPIW